MRRLLPLLLLILPALALAQASDLSGLNPNNLTPGGDDLSMSVLRQVFGEWGGSAFAPTVGAAMMVLNAGILVIGSVLFIYTAAIGIMNSAHDGEVLGKKWSSVWVPIRFAGGVVMIVPTASGFSIGQIFVMWVAGQGIGIANNIWSGTAESFISQQGAIVSVRMQEADAIAPAMRQILKAELCLERLRRDYPGADAGITDTTSYAPAGGGDPAARQGRGALTAYTGGAISWGGRAPLQLRNVFTADGLPAMLVASDACGVLELPSRNVIDRARGTLSEAESGMIQAQANAVFSAAAQLRPLAKKIIDAEETPGPDLGGEVVTALESAARTYIANVQQPTQGLADQAYSYLVASIKKDNESGSGWLSAGSWYYQMARINSEIGASTSWKPLVSNIPLASAYGGGGLSAQYEEWINGLPVGMRMRKPEVVALGSGAFGNRQGGLPGAFNTGAGTDFVLDKGMRAAGFNPDSSSHPIIQMKDTGDYIMGAVEGALIAAGAKDVVIEVFKKLTPVGRAAEVGGAMMSKVKQSGFGSATVEMLKGPLSAVSGLIMSGLAALFVVGVMMSLYLPMLPFLLWFGAVVGWISTLFIIVVCTPVWFAAHMHPEGEGMAGTFGGQGYGLLLDVLARPALMMMGLIGAMIVLPPILSILFGMFVNSTGSMQADSISGVVTWVVLICIYAVTCITISHKIFALIHIVPNATLKLLGLGQPVGEELS